MDQCTITSYQLPNIRCTNCNKPIGHLFESYKNYLAMNIPAIEVYEILGLIRVCCRKELGFSNHITITKPCEYKILGFEKPETIEPKLTPIKPSIKPIKKMEAKNKTINNKESKPCIPISITVSQRKTNLNDELWVSYVDQSVYLAQ